MTLDIGDMMFLGMGVGGFLVAAYFKGRHDGTKRIQRCLDAYGLANALQLAALRRQVRPWIGPEVRQ
jgi:hypothetical protein